MADFNREQIRDIMHAIRHYQYHHISISSPRYQEYSDILSKFEDNVGKLETDSTDTFDRAAFHDWLEQKQAGWSIDFGNET
jgi:hypothetical protein